MYFLGPSTFSKIKKFTKIIYLIDGHLMTIDAHSLDLYEH